MENKQLKKSLNDMDIYLTEIEIKQRIKQYIKKNKHIYENHEDEYIFVVVLKGALQFFSYFYNSLQLDVHYVFCKCRSYFETTQSSNIEINFNFNEDEVKNKNVVIIEDIYDSGRSCDKLAKKLQDEMNIKSISFIYLLRRYKNKIDISKYGKIDSLFIVNNERWVIGWGFDVNNDYRCLKNIYFYN